MTDNEIIKAFEHCVNTERGYKCRKCEYVTGCKTQLMREALDLINRLKVENERLQKENEGFAEVIKEFANKVIDLIYSADDINPINEGQTQDLAEETVGEG